MFTSTPFASTRSSAQANSVVGPNTKIATNAIIATASATPTCRRDSCSSSSSAWFDAIVSARTPIASDCPSTMIPRRNGLRQIGWRFATESIACDSTWIVPAGSRTASAQWSAPRIMTPSMTAWPP